MQKMCEMCGLDNECTCPPCQCETCRMDRGEIPKPEWMKRRDKRLALREAFPDGIRLRNIKNGE